jgi:7-keto-8-aminopelargonate synthetase-like enzyme
MTDSGSKIELVHEILQKAKSMGIIQKTVQNHSINDGKSFRVDGRDITFFGNCSYLGLEHDSRIKEASKEAIDRYGINFAVSRSFIRLGFSDELEGLLENIFEKPTISVTSTTGAHMCTIPTLVQQGDAIILDHQVHTSVSNAVAFNKSKGGYVELLRHNRLDLLEERIKVLRTKHKRIWYMVDSIYSMYGDVAPFVELHALMEKYEEFHLYVDDSHGLSWAGKNGKGYALSMLPTFHDKLIYTASLYKGFGASGAAMVFPNEQMKELVLNVGTTLMFSAPLQPSTMGAVIAASKIHLSDEIYTLQEALQDKIRYFMITAKGLGIPIYGDGQTPVCYITIGTPDVCMVACEQMLAKGFLLNPCSFPSVPFDKAGLRITINVNLTNDDIYEMLTTLAEVLKNLKSRNEGVEAKGQNIQLSLQS